MIFANVSPPRRATCPTCWQLVSVEEDSLTYEEHQARQSLCPKSGQTIEPLFQLGQVVATPGALEALLEADQPAPALLERHLYGDWGDIPAEDVQQNVAGVRQGLRLMSVYPLTSGVRVWLITEWDRSVTTLLLPQDY